MGSLKSRLGRQLIQLALLSAFKGSLRMQCKTAKGGEPKRG